MAVTVSFSAPGVPVLTPTLTDAVQAAWSYRSAAATSAASAATDAATITSLHTQFTIEYAAFVTAGQTFEINMANVYADFNSDYALWQAARDLAITDINTLASASIVDVNAARDAAIVNMLAAGSIPAFATNAEALAGTANNLIMTPLRVQEKIDQSGLTAASLMKFGAF